MIRRSLSDPVREFERRTTRVILVETLRSLSTAGDALTLPQLRTLLALSARGAETVTSLAETLKLRPSRIARVCTLLVTRGLVIRTRGISTDGEVVVALSTAGRRFVDDLIYDPAFAVEDLVEREPEVEVLSPNRST
jgi:DNA-binding MarR family transcriptional regulator